VFGAEVPYSLTGLDMSVVMQRHVAAGANQAYAYLISATRRASGKIGDRFLEF